MDKITEKKEKEIIDSYSLLYNNKKIRQADLTYKKLLFLCPKEAKYYLNYLSLHKEEEVFAEFLQNSYSESLDTCERAINNLDTNDLEPFYQRKLEIFIELIDGSFGSWYNNNTKQVNNFIDEISGKYSNNIPILKRLYRLLCIIDKEHEANILLNKLYVLTNGNDIEILFSKVGKISETDSNEGIKLLESNIENNKNFIPSLNLIYKRLLQLYKTNNNIKMVNHYDTLIDNLN